MRFTRNAALVALSTSLVAGPLGCAHAGPPSATTAAPATTTETTVTGSRLPQPVDPATGQATTPSIVRSYSSSQLEQTGRSNPGAAVQQLDPAVSRP